MNKKVEVVGATQSEFNRQGQNPKPEPPTKLFNSQLRAFQLQQHIYKLLEQELPRLLAPDLPSNRSSLRDLNCTHSNYQKQNILGIVIFCHCLPASGLGNLRACCLPWMW